MPTPTPRYLSPFEPKRVPHYFTDVLVVGSGLAGLRAATAVDPCLSVLVVTKNQLRESASNYAQGGIAGALAPEDCFEDHVGDTVTAGGALCDREVVDMVVRSAPERINELIQWGTRFDEEAGTLMLGREGGHGRHRVLHALGDSTGKEIMRVMDLQARSLENVQLWSETFTIDLLVHEGRCRGALIWNPYHGKTFVWAKQAILCSGGVGQAYRETTNPDVATGDGHAIAYRAGVELRDLEFMQFHPTVLYIAGSSRSLISEAMRGEGAYLIDVNDHRFMPDYDERAELAPRDIVAQAIVEQMEKTRHPNVFLDLSHLDGQFVRARFPGIAAACAKFGIDIAVDRIPVRPGAHYMIGGVTTDQRAATTLPGLWAAGEVTSSGLHGANRLASNSLLEALVYGVLAGQGASQAALEMGGDTYQALPLRNSASDDDSERLDLADIRNSLKSLMWRAAGVRREASQLLAAQRSVEHWCHYVLSRQFSEPGGWELQNLLIVARLILAAALERKESRGVHFRADFVPMDDQRWKRHLTWVRPPSEES